jgi:hypothetical protein
MISEKLEKVRQFLIGRQQAYRQVFNPESQATIKVLKDLARFCRANDPTFHADARMHAVLEGRREVFLRIQKHTGMNTNDFLKLYGVNDD